MTVFFNSSGPMIFAAAGLLLGMISTASAYTAEQQQLCTDDAFKLCGSDIPDVDRVTACMVQHKSQLSPGCKSVFRPAPEAANATTAPPSSATATAPKKPKTMKSSKRRRKPISQ